MGKERQHFQRPLILIVDDDPAIGSLARTILERANYEPVVATSMSGALEAVSQVCPDLILLDITLPDGDGYQAADKLKALPTLAGVPIIFLSGRSAQEDGGRSFAHGASLYLRKPFTQSQLREVVQMALQAGMTR